MAVDVYSTPTCMYCNMLKSYLRERGINFNDYNVAIDERKAEEMINKSRQYGVPVIDFNGQIIVGFNKLQLDKLIASVKNG